MASFYGSYPAGSSPVTIFSGASCCGRGGVNLAGVPASMRGGYARRFSGMGTFNPFASSDLTNPGYGPDAGTTAPPISGDSGTDSSFDWSGLLKSLTPVFDSVGKLLNPATANMSLPPVHSNLTADQIAALSGGGGMPKWLLPAVILGGAALVGAFVFMRR